MAAAPGAGPATSGLNVIALVSGGKDSFFSALHCLENGHRVVALANLHPPPPPARRQKAGGDPDAGLGLSRLDLDPEEPERTSPDGDAKEEDEDEEDQEEADLNSFMYQTVGHQVIPLYADATGIPLYRRPILGGAVHHGRDYCAPAAASAAAASASSTGEGQDETESMTWLLKEIMQKHPEANALSAGAILSTYQRTRVESVAVRLGLTPLAYLWKYPVLPGPAGVAEEDEDEAQLLVDMAAAGMEARLLKVASGGLDDSFLWENVASAKGVMRLKRAMGRFGASAESGAVLGEGGEFETLVVDGPSRLFKKRIVVGEDDRVVVSEGGGAAWMRIQRARLEDKPSGDGDEQDLIVRRPGLLDRRFAAVLESIRSGDDSDEVEDAEDHSPSSEHALSVETNSCLQTWAVTRPVPKSPTELSIKEETELLMEEIRNRLNQHNLSPNSIISTVISLRRMSDFPAINTIYGSLFTEPNPPSRVTISCGDLLPQSTNIAIYLTVHTGGETDRQGLHVQGRSYWAPANIGPYSQAITVPTQSLLLETGEARDGSSSSNGPRVVHIAGQIPLVPASMELPADGLETQLALSLQHLWRIGAELGVQWWTSGAVYFPRDGGGLQRSEDAVPAREKALLAWRAWKVAHTYKLSSGDDDDDDDEEDGNGPDLWDRKFNPAYMSYGGGGGGAEKQRHSLPDYSVLQGEDDEEEGRGKKPVPFFFAAEVDELPRSAESEWHAHAGLARVGSSPDSETPEEIALYNQVYNTELGRCRINHCALASDAGVSLHSVAAVEVDDASASRAAVAGALDETIEETDRLMRASMRREEPVQGGVSPRPYLLYADSGIFGQEHIGSAMRDQGLAVIPCASLYGGPRGERLAMVALYRNLSPAAA